MSMIVSKQHWDNVQNLRVDEVIAAGMYREEKLYRPLKRSPGDPGTLWDLSHIPPTKNSFTSIDDALAAVRHWCR